MSLRTHVSSILVFTILLHSSGASSAAKASRVFHVGIVGCLHDTMDDTMGAALAGIKTAKAMFENMHPGTNIDLQYFEHTRDLETVAAAANHVIMAKLPAVIGGELSEEALMIAAKLEPQGIVFVTPTSSHPNVTKGRHFVFQFLPSDTVTGQKLADFVTGHLHADDVGLIHDVSSPYTDYLGSRFLSAIKETTKMRTEKPIRINEEKILSNTTNFEKIVSEFKKKGIKVVAVLTHRDDLLSFVTEANRQNYHPVYMGCDGWGTPEAIHKYLVKESAAENFVGYTPAFWNGTLGGPLAARFRSSYQKISKEKPTAWSAVAFDSAWMLFESMNKATDPDSGKAIQTQLNTFKTSSLLTTRRFEFGADPNRSVYFLKIDSSGINLEATL